MGSREIFKLASLKETVKSGRKDELESLILAKLAQCRVIFDFSVDPLSDLKYKVRCPGSLYLKVIFVCHLLICL